MQAAKAEAELMGKVTSVTAAVDELEEQVGRPNCMRRICFIPCVCGPVMCRADTKLSACDGKRAHLEEALCQNSFLWQLLLTIGSYLSTTQSRLNVNMCAGCLHQRANGSGRS